MKTFLFTKFGSEKTGTFYARDAGEIRMIIYERRMWPTSLLEVTINSTTGTLRYTDGNAEHVLQWANEHSYDVFAQMAKRESEAVS